MTLLSANNYNNRSYTQIFALLLSLVFGFLSLETQALEAGADYCFYDKKQFKGESVCGNKAQSPWLGFKWAGRASSLQVAEGKEIVVYEYPWQLGAAEVFAGDVSKLTSGWNNRIVSFKMRAKMPAQDKVCFYKKTDYRGKRLCTNDSTSLISFGWYGKVKSISIPAGKQVTLYKSWFYRGSAELVASSTPKLRGNSKKFASFKIEDTNSNIDADSDGVNDTDDLCPNTLLGEVVNSDGCALTQLDTDSDGVNDAIDQCSNTESGAEVDIDGCSALQVDTDGDGVPDHEDLFPADPLESTDLDADGIGDNSDEDRDGDGVNNAEDIFPEDKSEAYDLDEDGIGDNADLDRDGDGVENNEDYFPDDPEAYTVPTVTITTPSTLSTVGSSPVRVVGTVSDIQATIVVNGVQIEQSNGSYEADVALEEGANNIIVRAIDAQSNEGTATVNISLDKTPPYIVVDYPVNESIVYVNTVTVSGLANDIVRGTVSSDSTVIVDGELNTKNANVENRTFSADGIELIEGVNTITVTVTDAVGNSASEEFTIRYEPQVNKIIEIIVGGTQEAAIKEVLNDPLEVRLTEDGQPVVGKMVVFRVSQGNGLLQPGTNEEGSGAVVVTDEDGIASVQFKLGDRAGVGNHKVIARSVGFAGEVLFQQSAAHKNGAFLGVIAGNNQRGSVRQPLPQPFTVGVVDSGANLVPGAQVQFSVAKGSGTFTNRETVFNTTTDSDGRASASYILGKEEGLDQQWVSVSLTGSTDSVSFTSSGFIPGDPGNTSISGVVLDNKDIPMPDVIVRIDGMSRQGVTNEVGQFVITEAPVGPVHLLVEGSTTTRAGEWPSLSFNIVTVPGVNNPLVSPVYLVELDTKNAVLIGAEDALVIHPDLPGFELEVKKGSVTFADGSKEGYASVTMVNSNKVPMVPTNGMQPQFVFTIQPHGSRFDPPARLTLPNTDGHAPLSQIEMYSYDHDLEEFVTIGLGTVSKDGEIIQSNLGSGIIKAGWGYSPPPPKLPPDDENGCCSGPGGGGPCGECMRSESASCNGGDCVPVPDNDITVCKSCVGGSVELKDGPIEDEECKECSNGEVRDKSGSCDDGLYCTSYDGELGGRLDDCQEGECVGKPVERTLIKEEAIAVKPFELLNLVDKAMASVGLEAVSANSLAVTGTSQVWSECCEATTSNDEIKAEEISISGSLPISNLKVPLSRRIRGVQFSGILSGDLPATGYYRKFETACESRDECADVQGGIQVNGVATTGAQVDFISPNILKATGVISGATGVAVYVEGCGDFGWQACFGPPSLKGEITVFSGLSRSVTYLWKDSYKCANTGGPGSTE
jgi:hypothetical protein